MNRLHPYPPRAEELKNQFIEKSIAQDVANLSEDMDEWLRLHEEIKEILAGLSQLIPDGREVLIPLYRHSNSQVRVNSAIATLEVAPVIAREALEWVARWDVGSQRTEAISTLSALDRHQTRPN